MIEIIERNYQQFGLHIAMIFGGGSGGFTYTVGMTGIGLPEVICFGLDGRMIGPYLNRYFVEIKSGLIKPGPGVLSPDDNWFNMPMIIIDADADLAREYTAQAEEFARHKGWPKPSYVQWCWPDSKGALPWEPSFEDRFKGVQPVLAASVLKH